MLKHVTDSARRRGVAALEIAVVLPLLFSLMIGVWELGRIIQVQQIMMNAARDGARYAAQGTIINTTGAYSYIRFKSGSPAAASPPTNAAPADTGPYVYDMVYESLYGAGITNLTGVNITFTYLSGDTTRVAPFQGNKLDQFQISITLPYANVQWTNLSLFAPTNLSVNVTWNILVDDPFTVSATLPGWNP